MSDNKNNPLGLGNNQEPTEEVTPQEGVESEGVADENVGDEGAAVSQPINIIDIREGDLFAYPNNTIGLSILEVSPQTLVGKIYRARLYSSAAEPVYACEEELINFINTNKLTKLTTFRDQMEEVAPKIILQEGEVYTQNGEFFLEVIYDELLYVSPSNVHSYVIGVRTKDGLVAFRDSLIVKAMVYQNTDQFPPVNS